MTDLHQQLQDTIRELEQIRKVREYTKALQQRLEEEQRALDVMEKTLDKEQRDVETLEKEGLTTMFRKFIGDREERLEKEREEYLKASLRYNELYKSVDLIKYELELLTKKEQNEEVVSRRLEVQMKMREDEIIRLDPQIGGELKNLHEQSDKLNKFSVEVEEAFNAGSEALNNVSRTEHFLREAHSWGQRDMWSNYGGSGTMKHQAIDQAKNMAAQSRHSLLRFVHEVKDVYRDLQLQVNLDIEEFSQFGDIFFDNIISDYLAQQKINKALTNVSSTRQQVEHVLASLEQEKVNIKSKAEDLEKQRKDLIVKASA